MEKRNQFTFYRSFWEALLDQQEADRLTILEAIICYALDGVVPKGLKNNAASFFKLCKPTLDAAWKKAEAGKKGGSKPKTKRRQTESQGEKEKKKENEIENEIEDECPGREGFERFWEMYPRKEGKMKAKEAYIRSDVDSHVILQALQRQMSQEQWQRDGGRFIPYPSTWLNQRRWEDEPNTKASARKPDAKEIAAVRRLMEDDTDSGTPGNCPGIGHWGGGSAAADNGCR